MYGYLFHTVLIAFLAGVAVATVVAPSFFICLWILLVGVGLGVVWSRNRLATSAPLVLAVSLTCCFFVLGLIRMQQATSVIGQSPLVADLGREVSLEGVVVREPERHEKSLNLFVKVDEALLLVTSNPYSPVAYGDRVAVTGTLEAPSVFTTDAGREFDYPHYLLARGVEYKISYAHVEVLQSGEGNPVIAFLLKQKHALMNGIERSLTEPQAGLGEGLLLGVKQALGTELEEIFRKAGIVHIVVLSGYNIMLVVAFTTFLLSLFFTRTVRIVVGLLMVVCFALIVGLSATVVRASIMAGLLLLAQGLYRTYDIARALILAAAIMVLCNPFLLLYDIGFQLSFMATLGLIFIAPKLEGLCTTESVLGIVREYMVATLATQIAVLPLLLYHMGEVSLVAVVVNVLVLPVVPLAMLSTFITGVVTHIAVPLALPVAFVAHLSLSYIILMATWFAAVPFAAVAVSDFPLSVLVVSYGFIAAGVLWSYKDRKESDFLNDWTIEEETEKTGEVQSTSPADTPIFFR